MAFRAHAVIREARVAVAVVDEIIRQRVIVRPQIQRPALAQRIENEIAHIEMRVFVLGVARFEGQEGSVGIQPGAAALS